MNKMNKMKRFLVALTVAAMFGTSFVSCIDNEVSPEIKKIYQGHADLLASQVTVNQAEAALKGAEATLKEADAALHLAKAEFEKAKAELEKAKIKGEEADAAKTLAEAAEMTSKAESAATAAAIAAEQARLNLQITQTNHSIALKKEGFAAADSLFKRYTNFRKLAESELNEIESLKDDLYDKGLILIGEKFDSITENQTLIGFKTAKKGAEVRLKETLAALASAKAGSSSNQKAMLDTKVRLYTDSIAQIAVAIQVKKNEKVNEQAKLDKLTGVDGLRDAYDALVIKVEEDSTAYNAKAKSKKAKNKTLTNYSTELGKLKAKVVTANANVKSAGVPHTTALAKKKIYGDLFEVINGKDAVAAVDADPTATPPVVAVDAVPAIKGLLDKLKDTTNALAEQKISITDIASIRKAASDSRRAHDSLKNIFDEDPAGPSVFAGIDGVRGNATNTTTTTEIINGVSTVIKVTYRIIKDVTFPVVDGDREKKVTFEVGEFFFDKAATDPDFPIKTPATTNPTLPAVKFTADDIIANFSDIDAATSTTELGSIGKLYNVEADDEPATTKQKNVTIFNLAVTDLAEKLKRLKMAEKSTADKTKILTRLENSFAELDALVINNGINLAAAKIAYINALKAIGIKVKTTEPNSVTEATVLATTKEAITTKKATAIGAAKGKVTAAEAAVTNFPTKDKLDVEIKLLDIEITALAAQIANNTAKITALKAKIASASNDVTGGEISALVASVDAIKIELTDLENTKASYILLKKQYGDVSTLILLGLDPLKTAVVTAEENLVIAVGNVLAQEKVLKLGWFDKASTIEFISALKVQIKAREAQVAEYLAIANKFRELAAAALALVTSTT